MGLSFLIFFLMMLGTELRVLHMLVMHGHSAATSVSPPSSSPLSMQIQGRGHVRTHQAVAATLCSPGSCQSCRHLTLRLEASTGENFSFCSLSWALCGVLSGQPELANVPDPSLGSFLLNILNCLESYIFSKFQSGYIPMNPLKAENSDSGKGI